MAGECVVVLALGCTANADPAAGTFGDGGGCAADGCAAEPDDEGSGEADDAGSDAGPDSDDAAPDAGTSDGAADGASDGGAGSATGDDGAPADDGGDSGDAGDLDACWHAWTFDDCDDGWTTGKATASAPGEVSWECGEADSAISQDGAHAGLWATSLQDRYFEEESSFLRSPTFDLDACAGATLYLSVAHTYELGGGDGGVVQISDDDGASWTTLMPSWNGYCAGAIQTGVGEPSGEPGFCGGDYDNWQHSLFPLDAYGGLTGLSIRFVFGSDSILEQEGWYIDAVTVEAYP